MLFPSDVKIDPNLSSALGSVAAGPQNTLQDLYGKIRARFKAGQDVSGRPTSDYNSDRMAAQENLNTLGGRSALEGVLGDTSYKDALSQREYEQNMKLAKEIGDLNAPSLLQEVLGGLCGAAKLGGGFASLYKALGSGGGGGGDTLEPSLSLYNPYSYGYARYS